MKLILLILLPMAMVSSSCRDERKARTPNYEKPKVYYTLGNPMNLIEGTEQNLSSFFSVNQIEDFNGYSLQGHFAFTPKAEPEYIDPKKLKEHNDTDKHDEGNEDAVVPNYRFDSIGQTFRYHDSDLPNYPAFDFENKSGRLELVKVNGFPVKVIHYSLSTDKKVFSILVEADTDLGRSLIAYYFTKNQDMFSLLRITDEEYSYLSGRRIAIPWQQDLEFSLCGAIPEEKEALFRDSIRAWETSPGKIGGLRYSIVRRAVARPFSDVVQNCIQYIQGYRLETQDDIGILGVAIPIINPMSGTIVAANSFIFEDAHFKLNTMDDMATTVTHEIGHVLGLGHEFKEDENRKAIYPSIMGYDGIDYVTSWDREAIEALYPDYSSPAISIVP